MSISNQDFSQIMDNKMKLFANYLNTTNMQHKKYQFDGVKWCIKNELFANNPHNIKGGLIADEMGLGKTIMLIGLIYCNFIANKQTLIVVPNILVMQWYNQIYKTTRYKPLIYYGKNKKNIQYSDFKKYYIIITTYNNISLGKKNNKTILHEFNWHRIIYDEAHHLRNKNSRYLGAIELKSQIKWLVTGTPIQNKKSDFYNLLSILGVPLDYYNNAENKVELIKNFVLKRRKKDVDMDNIELIIIEKKVSWKSEYEKNLSKELHSGLKFSGIDNMKIKTQSLVNSLKKDGVLSLLLHTKQVCIYPKLLSPKIDYLYKYGYINDYDYSFYNEALNYSSKLDNLIDDLIKNRTNNNGKLIFCHYRGEINEIYKRLRENNFNKIAIIDGRINEKTKNNILYNPKQILILQIQVGCEGLNLQEFYNEIYFVSIHWNPSIEDQAIARCARLGQTKPVYVYKYSMYEEDNNKDNCENIKQINIDNYIISLQELKRNIANNILN